MATAGMAAVVAQTPAGWTGVITFYRAALVQHGIVGSSLALVRDGRIVVRDRVGLRDRTTGRLKEILRPLGMTRTFFDRAPSFLRGDRSHSYFVTDAGTTQAPFDFDTGITVSNGGLNAPLDDMARYLGFLAGSADPAVASRYDAILKRSRLEEMWTPVVPVSDGVSMGLGFFLEKHGGLDFVAHSGGQNGFISHFYLHIPSRLASLVAFNTQTTSASDGDRRNTRALDAALRDVLVKHIFQEQSVAR